MTVMASAQTANDQAPLDASKLTITMSHMERAIPAPGSVEQWAQNVCSDHMVTCKWTVKGGWEAPQIEAFRDLSISPAASCLNYATTCFEGMKAFRGYDGKLRLFRPDCNAKRLMVSAERVCLPSFDYEELIKLVKSLLRIDAPRWLPRSTSGRFIYIRPAIIGTGEQLGIQIPTEATMYIMMVPWPNYSEEIGPGPIPREHGLRLWCSHGDTVRAWPGGFGSAKVGANYGTSLGTASVAIRNGYDQVLWLFGPDQQITEAGASNFFVVIRNRDTNAKELVTASLTDKLILDGVTRRSILELARSRLVDEVEVVERVFTMPELEIAWEEGRIVESFVCGTAFFITPVSTIHFRGRTHPEGRDLDIPATIGSYASRIAGWLKDIQYGRLDHEWTVIVKED